VAVMVKSEVKTNVKHPDAAVTVPGELVPVYVPMMGEEVLGPLYIVRKSKPDSMLKAVKFKLTDCPAAEAQMVCVKDWLFP
jgi:hypothetical protein